MKTNQRILWGLALSVLISLTIGFSPVQGNTAPIGRPDSQTKIFVQYKLIKAGLMTDHTIGVTVANREIVLTGTVPTLYDAARAEEIARTVGGKLAVVNHISVSAPSVPAATVKKDVMKRIETHTFYTVFDWVDVHADNGTVTLDGWVDDPWLIHQYQTEAEKVVGVKEVVNHLKVALGSDHLKYRAVRLIYSDPFYWQYSLEINPPIHVIVSGYNLILEGRVRNRGERAYLEDLLQFRTNAPNVVDNIRVEHQD